MSGWYWLIDRLPFEWAHFPFMQNALLAILLVSPLFALIGNAVTVMIVAVVSALLGTWLYGKLRPSLPH